MPGVEERRSLPSLERGVGYLPSLAWRAVCVEHHQPTVRWTILIQRLCLQHGLTEGWAWLVQGVFLLSVICSQVSCWRSAVWLPECVFAVGAGEGCGVQGTRVLPLRAQSQSPWEIEFLFSGSWAKAWGGNQHSRLLSGHRGASLPCPCTMATSLLGDGLWVCTVHSGEDIQALGTGAVVHAKGLRAASFIWSHFHL